MKSWRFFTSTSLYFENDTRYGHSYNGKRLETQCDQSNGAMIFNYPEPKFQGDADIQRQKAGKWCIK